MTNEEMERAFAQRLPVMAKINGIAVEECVLSFRCIHAIRRRWDETLGREVEELELLDRNRRGITVVPVQDAFLDQENCINEDAFDKCRRTYERYLGLLTPAVSESIDFYLREGMEPQLIIRIIEYAYEQGKHSWSYISVILMDKLKKNIKTLDAFTRAETERKEWMQHSGQSAATFRRNKFNNYDDTNKPDYSNFGEQILKEMLES